ncbi:MAG: hypothetical protein FJ044_01515 [Candidatus Cloacimonetes bacterium]|nr:hypothetical protein [Candidatus Cloacimonadota bacterium]
MTNEKINIKSETELEQNHEVSPELIGTRGEDLAESLARELELAKTTEVFRCPLEIPVIDKEQKEGLVRQLTTQLLEQARLREYWEGEAKGDRSYSEQTQAKIAEAETLQEKGDIDGLFDWVQAERYGAYRGESSSQISETIQKWQWRLGGQKRRDRIVTEEIEFLQSQAEKYKSRLTEVGAKITPLQEKQREWDNAQTTIVELESKARKIVNPEADQVPDSLQLLQQVKNEVGVLIQEIKGKKLESLSLSAAVHYLGEKVYQRGAECRIAFDRREEVVEVINSSLEEEFASIEKDTQCFGEDFLGLAEFAKGKILAKMIGEVGKIAEGYTILPSDQYDQTKVEQVGKMIDQLSEFAVTLGYDDIDVRRRFQRDETGKVVGFYEESLGGVLKALSEQIEAGIDLRKQKPEVYASMSEALGTKLETSLTAEALFLDQRIPKTSKAFLSYKDPETDQLFNISAYEAIAGHFLGDKAQPPEGTHFRLFKYEGELLVSLEHDLNEQVKVVQIMDVDLPREKETEKERGWINVRNLLLVSKQTGKVFDFASLLPEDYTLRYVPDKTVRSFQAEYGKYSEESPERFVQYADLTSPEGILALFHEYGHQIVTTNSDKELACEAQALWEQSRFYAGGAAAMPKDVFVRTKRLLAMNERGASARALWLIRRLKQEGISLGMEIKQITGFLDDALQTYEKAYPHLYSECGLRFTRKK